MKKKFIAFLIVSIFLLHTMSKPAAAATLTTELQSADGARYLFHQQLSDMCMIAPMLNLRLLENMRNADGSYTFPDEHYLTRRQWFVKNITPLALWHETFNTSHIKNNPELNALKRYLNGAITDGPSFPNYYTRTGSRSISLKATDLVKTHLETPYFFMDTSALKQTNFTLLTLPLVGGINFVPGNGLLIPLVKKNKQLKAGVISTEGNVIFENINLEPDPNLSDQYRNIYQLKMNPQLTDTKYQPLKNFYYGTLFKKKITALGFENVAKTFDTALGYCSDDNFEIGYCNDFSYFPYQMGLYKLMLLRLGITDAPTQYDDLAQITRERNIIHSIKPDKTPITIEESEKLDAKIDKKITRTRILIQQKERENQQLALEASGNIQNAVNSELHGDLSTPQINPWSDTYFSRDNFFEHHLALMLKEDRTLFNELSQTVDFYFKGWETYIIFLQNIAQQKIFKDTHGLQPYEYHNAKYYLPSEEYALAYHTGLLLRGLWYGALHEKAFYKATEVTSWAHKKVLGLNFKNFKILAQQKQKILYNINLEQEELFSESKIKLWSFLDVWQKIAFKFKQKTRKTWISFSAHGVVLTFDNQLIKLQNETPGVQDTELLSKLGCTMIESWLSSELPTFYKKK